MTRVLRAMARLPFLLFFLPVAIAPVACSSSSDGGGSSGGSSSGGSTSRGGSSGPGSSSSTTAGSDAGGCVVVNLTASELSCTGDSDCTAVPTSFCPGYVPTVGSRLGTLCPNAAANPTGVATITSAMATVPHGEDAGEDFCDALVGTPRCVQSQCVLCAPGGGSCPGGTSSSGSGSGGGAGSYAYCEPLTDAGTLCFAFPLTSGGPSAATVCAADSLDAFTWVSVPSCDLSGLSGCCGMSDTWQCFYGSESAESTCTSNGGTWSATSP